MTAVLTESLRPKEILGEVVRALKRVVDPEIGLNLVDLGLVYDVRIEGPTVHIAMTLTNPMCPMREILVAGVQASVRSIRGVENCCVRLVMDPPWNPCMISEEGRKRLGFL